MIETDYIEYHNKYFRDGLEEIVRNDIKVAKKNGEAKYNILPNGFVFQVLYHKNNIILKCANKYYNTSDIDIQCLVSASNMIIAEKKERDGWLWIKCQELQ